MGQMFSFLLFFTKQMSKLCPNLRFELRFLIANTVEGDGDDDGGGGNGLAVE